MKINFTKTKEMILGPLAKFSAQHLSGSSANNPVIVERVQQFKLLGITISYDMNWQTHIDAVITKASSRLYFLKILKKSGLNSHQLRHFYLSVIRPILEYWSAGTTVSPRPRRSHWKPYNAGHLESLTHPQSACLEAALRAGCTNVT